MKLAIATSIITTFTMRAFGVPTGLQAPYVRPMGINSTMIMESMQRSCNQEDTICYWSFGITVNDSRTECAFDVYGSNEAGARYSSSAERTCGQYMVASSWSGQFGEHYGFVTLSVVNYAEKTIAWPAYGDDQLERGSIVVPDQSYPMQEIK